MFNTFSNECIITVVSRKELMLGFGSLREGHHAAQLRTRLGGTFFFRFGWRGNGDSEEFWYLEALAITSCCSVKECTIGMNRTTDCRTGKVDHVTSRGRPHEPSNQVTKAGPNSCVDA
eukprot:5194015-Amphidinium_carterae.2